MVRDGKGDREMRTNWSVFRFDGFSVSKVVEHVLKGTRTTGVKSVTCKTRDLRIEVVFKERIRAW